MTVLILHNSAIAIHSATNVSATWGSTVCSQFFFVHVPFDCDSFGVHFVFYLDRNRHTIHAHIYIFIRYLPYMYKYVYIYACILHINIYIYIYVCSCIYHFLIMYLLGSGTLKRTLHIYIYMIYVLTYLLRCPSKEFLGPYFLGS